MISSKPRDHRLDGEEECDGQVAGHGDKRIGIFVIAMTLCWWWGLAVAVQVHNQGRLRV